MKSKSLQNNKNLAYCHGDKILEHNLKLLSRLMTLSRHCYFLSGNSLPTRAIMVAACCCCCCCSCIMFCIMFCIIFCLAASCSCSFFLIAISSLRSSSSICAFSLRNSTASPPLFLLLTFLSVLSSSSDLFLVFP